MKKTPTLTVAFLLLSAWGFRIAGAWQENPTTTDNKTTSAPDKTAAQAPLQSDPEAVELVKQVRNRLFERQSVQAEMIEIVSLASYTFRSQGAYSSASGFRYRLEYRVELGDLQGDFLEVCDGQVLHTRRQISESNKSLTSTEAPEIELSRRDIQKIRREALGIKETAQGVVLADALRAAEIGLGGLPAVLASLESSMTFDAVQPEMVEGQDYLVVQGHWKANRRERLLAGLGTAGGQVAGLMPDLVRIYISRETQFPEKFLYLKYASSEKKSYKPIVSVEFKNVVLDQPIPERQFVYVAPPGVEEKDETAAFLEAMRQTNQPPAPTP